jgi:hypothetical protein
MLVEILPVSTTKVKIFTPEISEYSSVVLYPNS